MEAKKPLRVLFCMGINQNFLMQNLLKQKRFGQHLVKCGMAFMTYLVCMFLGILMMTKAWWSASTGWPWTTYLLADVPDIETVHAACNLFRTTVVGEGPYKLWKYCKVEARVGRELIIQR